MSKEESSALLQELIQLARDLRWYMRLKVFLGHSDWESQLFQRLNAVIKLIDNSLQPPEDDQA